MIEQKLSRLYRNGEPKMIAYDVGCISGFAQGYDPSASTWKNDSTELHESIQRLAGNINDSNKSIRTNFKKVRGYLDTIRRRRLKRGVKGWRRMWLEVLDTFRLL